MSGGSKTAWRVKIMLAALALAAAGGAPAAPRPPANPRGPCDSPDKRAWRRLSAPPNDAPDLAAQAARKPSFSVPQHWVAEAWFGLGDSVLLCRSDAPLPRACAGEWWRFEPAPAGGRALADHDSFLCLASASSKVASAAPHSLSR
jgi:hypothetical protein